MQKEPSSQYDVERLLGRTIIDGKPHYQVKWQGTEETTWEPVENLEGVAWMVEELENAMNNNNLNVPDASGFEGWEQQMEDEYMQAEHNSIMHNQGLPIANSVQTSEARSMRPLGGLEMINNIRGRGGKRQGKDNKVKEVHSLPHDLTSESMIIKQSQKR